MRAPNDDQWSATGAIEAMKRGRIVPKTVQNWGKTVQNWGKTVQNWGKTVQNWGKTVQNWGIYR